MILNTVLQSARPTYDQELHLKGGHALWISDFEMPFHNAEFINQVFELAQHLKIKQAIWGGDAFHLEAFSPFKGKDSDAEAEIYQIDQYLPGFLEPFESIMMFVGNHDERLAARLNDMGVGISSTTALRILTAATQTEFKQKVTISEYRFMRGGTDWLFEHPKNASAIPGKTAQQLSSKYHKNVLCGHTHNLGVTMFNDYWAVETGHCLDADKLAYYKKIHTTRPKMAQGACLLWWDTANQTYIPISLTPQTLRFQQSLVASLNTNKSLSVRARPTRSRSKK